MIRRALITGASSGIGMEYARQIAAKRVALVLVGRDETALEQLATNLRDAFATPVEVLQADLLKEADVQRVEQRLAQQEGPVDLLINSAGFGLGLEFEDNDLDDEVSHIRIHNEVPMRLTHCALQGMLARGNGYIIQVSSVAAFIPRSTYSAVKQWLVGFSRWANARYRKRGVTVMAVCPGYTHTNFHERLGLPPGQEGIPGWMWLDVGQVVSESLGDLSRGKAVSIPSVKYKVLATIAQLAPKGLAAKIGERGR